MKKLIIAIALLLAATVATGSDKVVCSLVNQESVSTSVDYSHPHPKSAMGMEMWTDTYYVGKLVSQSICVYQCQNVIASSGPSGDKQIQVIVVDGSYNCPSELKEGW